MRADFNVPLKDGKITSNQRILATLPTIEYVRSKNPKCIILMSHLGRPDGFVNPKYSLSVVAEELAHLLKSPVKFVTDCVGDSVETEIRNCSAGDIYLLENLRFHPEEEGSSVVDGKKVKADPVAVKAFRHSLTSLGDVYVNDAFGTVHRAHSSIVGIDLPRVSGLLVKKELEYFSKALEGPKISMAILGGAKVSDKIQLIENMLSKVEMLFIGGGMAFTFLKVMGMSIGKSLFDQPGAELVLDIMAKAKQQNVQIILPLDFITADKFASDAKVGYATAKEGIPDEYMGLDIGPETCQLFKEKIKTCSLVLWNGPMGVFEYDSFSKGTKCVLDELVTLTENGAVTIVGGGDSATAVAKWDCESKLSHVSTGGGASLELLEGKELPGISSLTDKE